MNNFEDILIEKERDSIVSFLMQTDRDKIFLEYLNQEGRLALLSEILKEYPPTSDYRSRSKMTATLYLLVKSLGISKPLIFLSALLKSKPANINQRLWTAIDNGYISGRSAPTYREAKAEYINIQSGKVLDAQSLDKSSSGQYT
jgi:hypothetical protein